MGGTGGTSRKPYDCSPIYCAHPAPLPVPTQPTLVGYLRCPPFAFRLSISLRDLAACDLVLNGKALRAANVGEDIVNVQAKETAIRTALVAANGPALAAWSPGRIRGLADVLSMYVGGTHAMHASRIAVQLLFGRRSLVDMYVAAPRACPDARLPCRAPA